MPPELFASFQSDLKAGGRRAALLDIITTMVGGRARRDQYLGWAHVLAMGSTDVEP